jgi:hypothetical protein
MYLKVTGRVDICGFVEGGSCCCRRAVTPWCIHVTCHTHPTYLDVNPGIGVEGHMVHLCTPFNWGAGPSPGWGMGVCAEVAAVGAKGVHSALPYKLTHVCTARHSGGANYMMCTHNLRAGMARLGCCATVAVKLPWGSNLAGRPTQQALICV